MRTFSSPQDRAIAHVAALSRGGPMGGALRVSLNFHPDRTVGGQPILALLGADGCYRSQFETGIGNGGLTAYAGGDRWRWESRIFGAAYDSAAAVERPKYGALNFRRRAVGAAPRFGSAHFRLSAESLRRTTFCYPDSVFEPERFGTAERMSLIELARSDERDVLDDYVEAQVHGPVSLARDVEALVLDACFRDTEVAELAAGLPCPVEWHPGFRLPVWRLRETEGYRTPEAVALGIGLAEGGFVDARMVGRAVLGGEHDPQVLKHLWHHVARFGAPD
ncbi:DUF3626 domain-containing protein [Crossiella sp. CA198]|uniref:DUF3626 domain-containing protein n=1 Tax=Crossiella sp. CA198 TaxID=3455607 RepID=UPI003F8D12C8